MPYTTGNTASESKEHRYEAALAPPQERDTAGNICLARHSVCCGDSRDPSKQEVRWNQYSISAALRCVAVCGGQQGQVVLELSIVHMFCPCGPLCVGALRATRTSNLCVPSLSMVVRQ